MTPAAVSPKTFLLLLVFFLIIIGIPVFAQDIEFADGLTYNDFYAVTVYHSDGESFVLFDVASFESDVPPWPDDTGNFGAEPGSNPGEQMKYYFWVRRIGPTGAITYPLSFRKILEIEFTGPFGSTVSDIPQPAQLIIDGDTQSVSVRVNSSRSGSPKRFSGWFGVKEPPIPSFTSAKLTLSDGSIQSVYIKTDGFLGGIDEEFGTYAMLWIQHDEIEKLVFNHNGSYARCPECGAIFYDNLFEACPFDGAALIPPRERP